MRRLFRIPNAFSLAGFTRSATPLGVATIDDAGMTQKMLHAWGFSKNSGSW
jgi:hypothetical protein